MLGYKRGGWGDLLVGSKGSIYSDNPWNAQYVLLPERRFEDFKGGPPESLPRVKSHQWEWIEACKGAPINGSATRQMASAKNRAVFSFTLFAFISLLSGLRHESGKLVRNSEGIGVRLDSEKTLPVARNRCQ